MLQTQGQFMNRIKAIKAIFTNHYLLLSVAILIAAAAATYPQFIHAASANSVCTVDDKRWLSKSSDGRPIVLMHACENDL